MDYVRRSVRMRRSLSPRLVPSRTFNVYRGAPIDGPEFEVAKCARVASEPVLESLRTEYAALQDLNRKAGVALAGSIPRPILFQAEQGILRMSGVPGTSLAQVLHRRANVVLGVLNLRQMREYGTELGRWLQRFHGATASQAQPHNHIEFMKQLDATLVRSSHWLGESTLQTLRQRAQASSISLDGVGLNMAAAHGDFNPQNILVDGKQVGVVDFAAYRTSAPIYCDLSTFVAYVALLASKRRYYAAALRVLLQHFLHAYGEGWEPRVLGMFVLNATLVITKDGPHRELSRADRQRIQLVITEGGDENSWLGKILAETRGKIAAPQAVPVCQDRA